MLDSSSKMYRWVAEIILDDVIGIPRANVISLLIEVSLQTRSAPRTIILSRPPLGSDRGPTAQPLPQPLTVEVGEQDAPCGSLSTFS